MPIELLVTFRDGTKELHYMPLNETHGSKPVEDKSVKRVELEAWPWVNPSYTLVISKPSAEIATIEIDPSMRLADIDRKNNKVDFSKDLKAYSNPTR